MDFDLSNYIFMPIVIAGVMDSLSPCMLMMTIFFASFLYFSPLSQKQTRFSGYIFIISVLITSFFLASGTFESFRSLGIFFMLSRALFLLVGLLSIVLGSLCFYDWWVYQRTHDPSKFVFKYLFNLEHSPLENGEVDSGNKFLNNLKIASLTGIGGFLICLFGSVCTGQFYLPAVMMMLSSMGSKVNIFWGPASYSFVYIAPLIAVFFFVMLSIRSQRATQFAKRHISKSKIITSALFFGLGLGLIFTFTTVNF